MAAAAGKKQRCYVHVASSATEGAAEEDEPLVVVVKYDADATLEGFRGAVLAALRRKAPGVDWVAGCAGPRAFALRTIEDGAELAPAEGYSWGARAGDVLVDRADLQASAGAESPEEAASALPAAPVPQAAAAAAAAPPAAPPASGPEELSASAPVRGIAMQLVAQARAADVAKQFRNALKLYGEAEKLCSPACCVESLEGRAALHQRCGDHEAAVKAAATVLAVRGTTEATAATAAGMCRSLLELGKLGDCIDAAQEVISLLGPKFGAGDADASDGPLATVLADEGHADHKAALVLVDAQSYVAQAMLLSGDPRYLELGVRTLEQIISYVPSHVDSILAYSHAVVAHGELADAISLVLRGVVLDRENKLLKERFGALLRLEGSAAALEQALPRASGEVVPAYAFLATLAKDAGCIAQAIDMLDFCVTEEPGNASYALNLVHLHEIDYNYFACMRVLRAYLEATPDVVLGGVVRHRDFLEALEAHHVFAFFDTSEDCAEAPEDAAGFHRQQLSLLRARHQALDEQLDQFDFKWVKIGKDKGYASIASAGSGAGEAADPLGAKAGPRDVHLDEAALDGVAVLFTCVKGLYMSGLLHPLPDLIRIIEPMRVRLKKPLHKTTIRNEAAYYCCIAQVMALTFPRDGPASKRAPPGLEEVEPLYVCGDSHSITPAWSWVTCGEAGPRPLVPRLVTGLKHWHLRPETNFYPKYNFLRAMESLPDGADAIMIFGEIDCREGILVAVDKGRYESVEDGIAHTLDIFFSVLDGLLESRGFRVFMHPVLPVLNETRAMVAKYNEQFRRRTLAAAAQGKRVHWLDFEGELLDGASGKLRADLELDGTHIHPSYLALVEAALQQSLQTPDGT